MDFALMFGVPICSALGFQLVKKMVPMHVIFEATLNILTALSVMLLIVPALMWTVFNLANPMAWSTGIAVTILAIYLPVTIIRSTPKLLIGSER